VICDTTCVCLSVCLSAIISPKLRVQTLPNVLCMIPMDHGVFLHRAMDYGRGSDSGGIATSLSRTSGFVDDVVFAHNGQEMGITGTENIDTKRVYTQSNSIAGRTGFTPRHN